MSHHPAKFKRKVPSFIPMTKIENEAWQKGYLFKVLMRQAAGQRTESPGPPESRSCICRQPSPQTMNFTEKKKKKKRAPRTMKGAVQFTRKRNRCRLALAPFVI